MSGTRHLSQPILFDVIVDAPIGIGVCDKDGRFLAVNRALARLLDRPEEQIIGRPFLAFVHPDERATRIAEYFEAITAAAAGVRTGSRTVRCLTGARKSVWVDTSWTMTGPDESGRHFGILYLIEHGRNLPSQDEAAAPANDGSSRAAHRHHPGLTRRETEVLALVVDRYDNAEIAALLGISKRTVESHVTALLRKLAAADRATLRAIGRDCIAARTPRCV